MSSSPDLSICDREPIHIPGKIQNYGMLCGIDPETCAIKVYSENFQERFPKARKLQDFIAEPELIIEKLRGVFQQSRDNDQRYPLELNLKGTEESSQSNTCWTICYAANNLLIIECEQPQRSVNQDDQKNYFSLSLELTTIPRLNPIANFAQQCKQVAEWTRSQTGYDRVMVYRFDHLDNGQVIAEAKREDLPSYLDLWYPATDIPTQARALYRKNWIRMIADTGQKTSVVHSDEVEALDMSHSLLRAVSPVHLEYLQNMGVRASLSVSLMIKDKLWGLLVCHHQTPRYLSPVERLNLEIVGQSFSHQLEAKEREQRNQIRADKQEKLHALILLLASKGDIKKGLQDLKSDILDIQDACGFAYYTDKKITVIGETPEASEIRNLLVDSQSRQREKLIHKSDHFRCETNAKVAGYLLLPLFADNLETGTIWFREERARTVQWGGKPEKITHEDGRISPRKSFAAWEETVRNHSNPWTEIDIELAEKFSVYFLGHVIKTLDETRKLVAALKKTDRAKDIFLANVSHELRTPLNSILGWTQLALNGAATAQDKIDALHIIQNNAKTQNELINDLLDYSRIISGNLKIKREKVFLPLLATEVCEGFATAASAKKIIINQTTEGHSISVLGDRIRIKQIIWNLISNAIKFSTVGSKVDIHLRKTDDEVIIEVADEGRGIAKDDLEKVFSQFLQVDSQHGQNGLGLGLTIVKNLVDLHAGKVAARSAGLDQGTTFCVSFPTVPAIFEDDDGTEEVLEASNAPRQGRSGLLQNLQVLVAEDEKDAAGFLEKALAFQGAKVEIATNGREALEILKKQSFDLLISDIGMPEMDGYELIKTIRKSSDETLSALKSIALTAYSYPKDRIKALDSGFNSYASKPVSTEELFAVILSVIRG